MAEEKKTAPVPEAQKPEPPAPEVPDTPHAPEQGTQAVIPGMEGPPLPENKVIDLSSIRAGAGQEQQTVPGPGGWPGVGEKATPPSAPPEQPFQPKDASRGEKEEIVYLDLSELHPFGVRDDMEMQGLVSSVKAGGVHQPGPGAWAAAMRS